MLKVAVRKQRNGFQLDAAFEAPTPGVVALFGRSGCGKSTLVNLIAGLLEPDAGTIELDGTRLFDTHQRIDRPTEHRQIGYVFQDARLFPHFDVLGNLRYGLRRARTESHRIGLDEVATLLGLEKLLRRRPHELSGGERQRVALGRALLAQPRLLLLDEPLASLDVARREEVLPYLEKLRDHFAIPMVYVSHQFDEVLRLATHVVLLDEGKVVSQGELSRISLDRRLRSIVGPESIGAVLDGEIVGYDDVTGLAHLRIGAGTMHINSDARPGARVRVQLLARDLILALHEPHGLSVRNSMQATVRSVSTDDAHADLVELDIGGATVISRITTAATREMGLQAGMKIWVLVKAVSMRGHSFAAPALAG